MQFILKVTEVLAIAERGVVVLPPVPLSQLEDCKLPSLVELRLPEGSTKHVAAHFSILRVNPAPQEPHFFCMLPGQEKTAVPWGTEIWAELERIAS